MYHNNVTRQVQLMMRIVKLSKVETLTGKKTSQKVKLIYTLIEWWSNLQHLPPYATLDRYERVNRGVVAAGYCHYVRPNGIMVAGLRYDYVGDSLRGNDRCLYGSYQTEALLPPEQRCMSIPKGFEFIPDNPVKAGSVEIEDRSTIFTTPEQKLLGIRGHDVVQGKTIVRHNPVDNALEAIRTFFTPRKK